MLEATSDYVLGRPRIERIEARYIPDANTMIANLRAGTVDVTGNVGSIELGLQLRDQWRDGTAVFNFGSNIWVALYPQFIDPRPSVVADVLLRRALLHAIDRQEIVDTLLGGVSPVAYSILNPSQPQYGRSTTLFLDMNATPEERAACCRRSAMSRGQTVPFATARGKCSKSKSAADRRTRWPSRP